MKLIVAGSRNFKDYEFVKNAIDNLPFKPDEIVSGNASGVDQSGEKYAKEKGIDLVIFPANWTKHGKSGGCLRNERMINYADALLVIWDGESRGTQHMISLAIDAGLKVWKYLYDAG